MTTPVPVRRPRRRYQPEANPVKRRPAGKFVIGQAVDIEKLGPGKIVSVARQGEAGVFGSPFGSREPIYRIALTSGGTAAVPERSVRTLSNPAPAASPTDDDALAYAEGDDEHGEPIDDDLGDEADEDRGEDEAPSDTRRTRHANPRVAVYPLRPLDDEDDDEDEDDDDEDDDLIDAVADEAARSAAEFDGESLAKMLPVAIVGGLLVWALLARPRPAA